MPNGSISRRRLSDRPSIANFEALYGAANGVATRPPTELMLIMRPGLLHGARRDADACETGDGNAADEALESGMLSRSFPGYEFVRQQE